MKRGALGLGVATATVLLMVGCRTGTRTPGSQPTENPRKVAMRICEPGQCQPCTASARGIAIETDISRDRPVECDWDDAKRVCRNDGSRLAWTINVGSGPSTLEVLEKGSGRSGSPDAWDDVKTPVQGELAVLSEPAANLKFQDDGYTDWQFTVRVRDQDGRELACTDPTIFIHKR